MTLDDDGLEDDMLHPIPRVEAYDTVVNFEDGVAPVSGTNGVVDGVFEPNKVMKAIVHCSLGRCTAGRGLPRFGELRVVALREAGRDLTKEMLDELFGSREVPGVEVEELDITATVNCKTFPDEV